MKKILLYILIAFATMSNAQPMQNICGLPNTTVTCSNVNSPYLRTDNCNIQFGSIPYLNSINQIVENNSLWFDGQCIWVNGSRICAGGGGAWNCDSTVECVGPLITPLIDTIYELIYSAYTANNGLSVDTISGTDVFQLGGYLIQPTSISTQHQTFNIADTTVSYSYKNVNFFINDTVIGFSAIDSNGSVQCGVEVHNGFRKDVFIYSDGGNGQSSMDVDRGNIKISSGNGADDVNIITKHLNLTNTPSYASSTAAESDATLKVGDIYYIGSTAVSPYIQGMVFVKY